MWCECVCVQCAMCGVRAWVMKDKIGYSLWCRMQLRMTCSESNKPTKNFRPCAGILCIGICRGIINVLRGVIPIGAVVTAVTGFKKQSRGQGLFLVSVKQSRTIFKLSNSSQDFYVLHVRIAHSVVKCVQSNRLGPVCDAVKWSSNKNDS